MHGTMHQRGWVGRACGLGLGWACKRYEEGGGNCGKQAQGPHSYKSRGWNELETGRVRSHCGQLVNGYEWLDVWTLPYEQRVRG